MSNFKTKGGGEIVTKQSFADEVNVNAIMRKYRAGHPIEHFNSTSPSYGDFSNVTTYKEAVDQIMAAEERFNALPSEVRKAANNTPQGLLEYLDDESNREEAEQFGLLIPQEKSVPSTPDPEPDPGATPPTTT